MNRRDFIKGATAVAAMGAVSRAQGLSPPQKPNILFILADDLGYGDLSSFGRKDYSTPVLDRLVREGLKFTDAYSSAPVCTPARCAYMTGRYAQRLPIGLQEPLLDGNTQIGLPPAHPTVATQLKLAGYDTAVRSGNWKYLRDGTAEHLFDLTADPGESTDLRTRQPERFQKLRSDYRAWEARILA